MDDRLEDIRPLSEKFYRKQGLSYYASGENHDYISDELLLLTRSEADQLLRTGDEVYKLLITTVERCLGDEGRLDRMGIPGFARDHLRWSWRNEREDHLFGRMDFAGGFDGLPPKLLEFNADTSSLLPETVTIQPEVLRKSKFKAAPNRLSDTLTDTFKRIGKARGGSTTLTAYLGNEDDQLNLAVLSRAATAAGWKKVDTLHLSDVTFDPEGGMMMDLGNDNFVRYNYLVKFFPWDWIAGEEPDLWQLLAEMSEKHFLRVLNPAWTMLLQSKALLAFAYEDNPGHPNLLPTVFDPSDLPNPTAGYVRKPIFGRAGENIMLSLSGRRADAETRGDYGDQPVVYQAFTKLNVDSEDYRYQVSTHHCPEACALSCRRQEGWVIGEDAEFVPLGVER